MQSWFALRSPVHQWPAVCLLNLLVWIVSAASAQTNATPDTNDPLAGLPLLLEIDPTQTAPTDEIPNPASRVENILGRPARILPMGPEARRLVYRIGSGKELKAGQSYVLEVEYPDDVPRAWFMANRGADLVRGWATGTATGDARRQYVEPSLESLAYPQTGRWLVYRQFFTLQERFQGLVARRNPDPGSRPHVPADGFHLLFFQTYQDNDPRSQGLAVGRIRLFAVPDLARFRAPLHRPPAELPQRRVFWREEMADQGISAKAAVDRAFVDPLSAFEARFRLAHLLGIDTFAKDLLEFGFNQGWESGDAAWCMDAQPPLQDLWTRLVPRAAAEGFTLLPYYEFKGSLGWQGAQPPSLGWQRRAEKLYHGIHKTGDDPKAQRYTGTWFTEDHNADLTDPETLADFERVLERTVTRFKWGAGFAGVWLRTRHTHLPISFSDAAVARFRAAFPTDAAAQTASRRTLIASYEGDRVLYGRYVDWWFGRRAAFLESIRDRLGHDGVRQPVVLFTPWISEQVPELLAPPENHAVGVVTDDPGWWQSHAASRTDPWFRWKWPCATLVDLATNGWWARSLALRPGINDASTWSHAELFHSAPGADPVGYQGREGVMLTYPMGRLFTVAGSDPLSAYRTKSGLAAVHHFTLNENDEPWEKMDAGTRASQPFQGVAGYVAVDVDRAGSVALLTEARAIAVADPTHLGFLCASALSTGFPLELQRFFRAFQAVPALPSRVAHGAASDPEVVVREIPTERHGTYFLVVNPSWHAKSNVRVTLPVKGVVKDLVADRVLEAGPLVLQMEPAALRAFHVPPGGVRMNSGRHMKDVRVSCSSRIHVGPPPVAGDGFTQRGRCR